MQAIFQATFMHIEYERMGCDMGLGGDVSTVKTGYQEVQVFWSH